MCGSLVILVHNKNINQIQQLNYKPETLCLTDALFGLKILLQVTFFVFFSAKSGGWGKSSHNPFSLVLSHFATLHTPPESKVTQSSVSCLALGCPGAHALKLKDWKSSWNSNEWKLTWSTSEVSHKNCGTSPQRPNRPNPQKPLCTSHSAWRR